MRAKDTLVRIARLIAPPFAFHWAKRQYHRFRNFMVRRRVVKHVYGGVPLSVHIMDRGSRAWYDHDWPELREIQLLSDGQLRPGATVFDIGAHHAVVAVMLADKVGPSGKVIAVEANPEYADVARRNVALNHFQNITVVSAMAAAEPGLREFAPEADQVYLGQPGMMKMAVKARTLDDLADEFGRPDVLFIDVEGFERQVLQGATKCLRSGPDLFIEVHVGLGLEKCNSCVEDVFQRISPGFEILVAPPEGDFRSLADAGDITSQRFFIVAQSVANAAHRC